MSEKTKQFCMLLTRVVLGVSILVQGLQHTIGGFDGRGIEAFTARLRAADVPFHGPVAWVAALGLVATGLLLIVGAAHRFAALFVILASIGAVWFFWRDATWDQIDHELQRLGLATAVYAFGPGMFAFHIKTARKKDD